MGIQFLFELAVEIFIESKVIKDFGVTMVEDVDCLANVHSEMFYPTSDDKTNKRRVVL